MLSPTNVVVDGVRSAIHDTGPHDQPEAVVFVHGYPGAMDDWESLIPEVSLFARVVAMDLPGFGRAERPRVFDFTVQGYAHYLAGLLETQGIRRAHLVMHDFGGGFGLTWAVDHPDAFASATLIDTGILPGYKWHRPARIWQTPLLGELLQLATNARSLKLVLDHENPRPLPQAFVDRVASYADWQHKQAALRLYRNSKAPDDAFGGLQARLQPLDRPACVVWGAEDHYVPASFAQKQLLAFPRARIHVLPGLGHWPFVDDPDAVRDVVVPFLQEQIGSSR